MSLSDIGSSVSDSGSGLGSGLGCCGGCCRICRTSSSSGSVSGCCRDCWGTFSLVSKETEVCSMVEVRVQGHGIVVEMYALGRIEGNRLETCGGVLARAEVFGGAQGMAWNTGGVGRAGEEDPGMV